MQFPSFLEFMNKKDVLLRPFFPFLCSFPPPDGRGPPRKMLLFILPKSLDFMSFLRQNLIITTKF